MFGKLNQGLLFTRNLLLNSWTDFVIVTFLSSQNRYKVGKLLSSKTFDGGKIPTEKFNTKYGDC